MTSLTTLSAADLSRAVRTFEALLRAQKEVINRLNVYPVPDGDTGTNMALTMASVAQRLAELPENAPLGEVTAAIARASLMGARGNSGVILSQMLRGLLAEFGTDGDVDVASLRAGLVRADELARQAVSNPVEGTILSVARAAAEAAQRDGDLTDVVREARDGAKAALARTPDQLPVLKQAGVVDSGGTGLVLWFEALCHVVNGDPLPVTPALGEPLPEMTAVTAEQAALAELRYEVMFLLEGRDEAVADFRAAWEAIGDSIVIIGGDGLYNCHIHTDHIGPAIEAALEVGRPRDIRVSDLLEQVREEAWVLEATDHATTPPSTSSTAVVAVVAGDGVAALYRSLGVHQLIYGGQTMNPSTAELVAAVNATGAAHVIILPNNKNIRAVAEQVNDLVAVDVRVVPTTSVVEGLGALVAFNASLDGLANATAMEAFADGVSSGEVTQAVRDTDSPAGAVREGDWIGLSAAGIVAIETSLEAAVCSLAEALVDEDCELVTVLEGEGASSEVTDALVSYLGTHAPGAEVEVHVGGQPLYPYLLGCE